VALSGAKPLLLGAEAVTYVDVDSLLRRVYGKAKQGAGFGHTKAGGYSVLLHGLSPLIATVSTPVAAPVIAAVRLRGGPAGSARGAASLVAEALAVARKVGGGGTGAAARGLRVLHREGHRRGAPCRGPVLHYRAQQPWSAHSDHGHRRAGVDRDSVIRGRCGMRKASAGSPMARSPRPPTPLSLAPDTRSPPGWWSAESAVRTRPAKGNCSPATVHVFLADTTFSATDADLTHRAHA
jgi:hypothetical protein